VHASGRVQDQTTNTVLKNNGTPKGVNPQIIRMYKQHKQYRLTGYDYSQNGFYFITIVTKNRIPYFGKIEKQQSIFSPIGKYMDDNFQILSEKIAEIKITEYVIMPDHIHLILSIENNTMKEYETTEGIRPLIKGSVSAFINHLKGNIKRWCNENGHADFAWQARFHDRIIRDADEHERIVTYLKNNVINWKS
jgi:putative transposase